MKRIVLTIGIALLTAVSFAQKKNVTSAALGYSTASKSMSDAPVYKKELLEAKKYIDLAMDHPDTKNDPKGLMYKGKIYIELSALAASSPDTTGLSQFDSEVLFEEGVNALKKSKEVDTKGRYEDDVDAYANQFRVIMSNQGIASFQEEDYKMAMSGLLAGAKFGEILGFKDSVGYFYGGIAAYNEKEYATAIPALRTSMSIGYNTGESVNYLAKALVANGQKEEADKAVNNAMAKYPNDMTVLVNCVDYFVDADRIEDADVAITKAVGLDPTNIILVYNSGIIYEKIGKMDEAEAAYRKTLEMDPNHTNAKYSLGVFFFNKGADAVNEANDLEFGDPNYDKLISQSKEYWKEGLPFLEAAAEDEPKDAAILEALKAIYGKLGMVDKFKETKARIQELN